MLNSAIARIVDVCTRYAWVVLAVAGLIAILFLPTEELARTTRQLSQASPVLGALTTDPSLRGLSQALSGSLVGLRRNQFSINDLTRPLNMFADGIETVLAGQPAHFSWM